ncbi:MAG: HEAT repeat domain-containing protein [Planctomycetes bacterium]|nr:HEAT repeat domain-containing protein [Planctomycetota bacterium]
MSKVLALFGGLALFATGLGAGVVMSSQDDPGLPDESGRVVVKLKDGEERTLTVAEAAARIERLEEIASRPQRARAARPEEDAEPEAAAPAPLPPEANVPVPTKPDGKQYSVAELRDLAQGAATDPVLRLAAIRALRRDDSPQARAILGTLLEDPKTPLDARVEAAKALSRPPHRDQTPDELVRLLASPDLPPDVRREVADGVTKLRDRGAWMSEIAGQFAKETDPEVRKLLFDSVQRSAWDPAAKLELLALAANGTASIDDRRLAVAALVKQGGDRQVLETLKPLLSNSDAVLRESAVLALARADKLSLGDIQAALGDDNAAVRAAALAAKLPNGKDIPKDERAAAIQTAVRLATTDPSPDVRKAALAWAGAMPKDAREQILETARNDGDPLVRIEAYSRSPAPVVRQQAERVLSDINSPDARVRDAAYRLVVKTWNVDVPFRAGWNQKARDAALAAIRAQVARAP